MSMSEAERKQKIEDWKKKNGLANAANLGAANPTPTPTTTVTQPTAQSVQGASQTMAEETKATEPIVATKGKKAKPEPIVKPVPTTSITLPAIHGQMDEISYFQSNMTMQDVADRLHYAEDDYDTEDGDLQPEQKYQRQINHNRVKSQILPYLASDWHFFAPLVVALNDGEYDWVQGEMGVGMLTLKPNAICPILDGQHRKKGIDLRLEDVEGDDTFPIETVGVVFVPNLSTQQRQQLFSDLNRNAKLPPKAIGILYDHRELGAVITRMVADVPALKGKVNMETNVLSKKPLESSGKYAIMTLGVCYEMVKSIIFSNPDAKGEKQVKPEFEKMAPEEVAAYCGDIIVNTILRNLPMADAIMRDVTEAPDTARKAYICYSSLGWQSLARAVGNALTLGVKREAIAQAVKSIDWSISAKQWSGCVTTTKAGKLAILVRKDNVSTAISIITAAIGLAAQS